MSDELILKLPKEKALEQIFLKYHSDIFRYSYALTGNKTDAEDITSDSFLELNIKINSFDWRNISIKAWLLKTAKFKFYSLVKKTQKVETRNELFLNLPDVNISVENTAINDSLMRSVKESLKFLSIDEQEIIVLRIWEDLRFKEIAEIIDSNADSVKKKYYRSIGKLKTALSEENIKVNNKKLRLVFLAFGGIHGFTIGSSQSQNALLLFLSTKLLIPLSIILVSAAIIGVPTTIYLDQKTDSPKTINQPQNLNNNLNIPTVASVFPTSINEEGLNTITLKYPGEKEISFSFSLEMKILKSGFRVCSGNTNEENGEYAFIYLYSAKYEATLELNFSPISELKLRPNMNIVSNITIGNINILGYSMSVDSISPNIILYNSGQPILYQDLRFTAFVYSGNILSNIGEDKPLSTQFIDQTNQILQSLEYK